MLAPSLAEAPVEVPVSNTVVLICPVLAVAIGRRGVVAPRVPSDPDAVFQILVSQRPRPCLHVDEP